METWKLVVSGALAGAGLGYVLQRSDLCFHSAARGLYERRYRLARTWILGVALASVGLALVYASPWWGGLNQGLAFHPVRNVSGGVIIGVGMVVAASCTSGLFYKLGSGMLGALVGIGSWGFGELAAKEGLERWRVPGSTALRGGIDGTIPGWLGVPRLVVAVPFLLVVLWFLSRARDRGPERWAWGWPVGGVALGVATVAAWMIAGAGGASFGPSTVGAAQSIAEGRTHWWLVAFLPAITAGAAVGARRTGAMWVRGESVSRYLGLGVGGFLLGAGGKVGGGCNLGHGLSGVAQLNVSSWVVVASIIAGVGLARAVQRALVRSAERRSRLAHWSQLSRPAPHTA